MKYQDARETIQSGDLLAWSHRGWRSWSDFKIQMVRFFTQSEFSHVGVAWVIGGRVLVIEAVTPKVRIYPLSKLGSFYQIAGFLRWSPTMEEAALASVGGRYSQLEALAAYWGKSVDSEGAQCAKLMATLKGIEPSNITPSQLVDHALVSGGVLVKIEH